MKLRLFLLMLALVPSAWATEHTDPLSHVRYDIPQGARTQEKSVTHEGSPGYMLAYMLPNGKAAVVLASFLKEGELAGLSDEAILNKSRKGMRPTNHFTKEGFRNIAGKRYHVMEFNEADGNSTSYSTMYTLISPSYVFTICFSTDYDQVSMQETWNGIVSQVIHP